MGYVNISVTEVVESYEFVTLANELGERIEKCSKRVIDPFKHLVDYDGIFIVIDLTPVNETTKFFLDWYAEILILKKIAKVMFRVKWNDHQEYLV